MRAILLLAQLNAQCHKLIDQMADSGDFEVPADFFTAKQPTIQAGVPIDTVNKAYTQGGNAAQHSEVLAEHNPYSEGSEEAIAWLQGFQETRKPAEAVPEITKPKRKARAKQ